MHAYTKGMEKPMKRWRFLITAMVLLLLTACASDGIPEEEPPVKAPATADHFEELRQLSDGGLLHSPDGWGELYGAAETPAKWWERSPKTVVEGDNVTITCAAPIKEDAEVWLEWIVNGVAQSPLACSYRANKEVDGTRRAMHMATLTGLSAGDRIEYAICSGKDGVANHCIGTFSFSVFNWESFEVAAVSDTGGEFARLYGKAGGVQAELLAQLKDNVLSLTLQNTGMDTQTSRPLPASVSSGSFRVLFDDNRGGLVFNDGDKVVVRAGDFQVLTDGENVAAVRLSVDAQESDSFYGFGMKYDGLNQHGKTLDTYCVNWYTQQEEKTYTPVPYYFVPDSYGFFADSTYYSQFDMCDTGSDCVITVNTESTGEFSVPLYFMAGTNTEISAAYASLAGNAALPPVWAFGPWISANEWNKQSEVEEQLAKTLENEISTTVVVLEAWSDEETFYTWNDAAYTAKDSATALAYEDFTFSGKWQDPKGMIDTLHENDIRLLLWQIPVLKSSSSATLQSQMDQIYAADKGYVLEYSDGETYRMPNGTWFGNSLLVDFTNENAVNWFLEKRRYLIQDMGVDGFKTDGGEFVWGADIVSSDGRSGNELRNAYPDLYAQSYYDYANERNPGSVTFSRAGGSSMQSHPLCWVGDQKSTFEEYRAALSATLSASVSGIPFVAWDIAGFSGDIPSTELYLRSVAQAAFSPVMQLHSETAGDPVSSHARTPWNMAERTGKQECLVAYKFYANLRMNLMPYIYTEARHASAHGQPLMRCMAYEYPLDKVAAEFAYQYMFGRQLLVAPFVEEREDTFQVYLPEGVWYGFFDGVRYEGGKTYTLSCPAGELAVFAREGAILPVNTHGGVLPSYVGNSTSSYDTLGYMLFPGTGAYTWFDYVAGREITVHSDGETLISDGVIVKEDSIVTFNNKNE
jgi:alpha-glucosidase (family GH31 glycosyl hydrolase)